MALGVLGYRIWKGQAVPPGGPTAASAVDARQESSTNHRFVLLLLGVDERSGDVGRSDTIMVAAIDYDRRTAELLSIPRDTFARIPGHGWNKINAAYAQGAAVPEVGDGAREGAPVDVRRGAELAARTISELAGRPVQHWAVVSIAGFAKLVDRVGGVEVEIPRDMHYEDPRDTPPLKIHFRAGRRRLNGAEAMKYVRYRSDSDSDWGRQKRQQQLLRALAAEARRPRNLPRLPGLLGDLSAMVKTDLSTAEILRLGLAASRLGVGDVRGDSVDAGADLWLQDYYFVPDFVKMREKLYRVIVGANPPDNFMAQARRDAAAYQAAASSAKATFEARSRR